MKKYYNTILLFIGILIFPGKSLIAQNEDDWSEFKINIKVLCPNTVLKDTTAFSYYYSEEGFNLNDITPKLKQHHCITTKSHDFCSFILNQPILTIDDSIMLNKWIQTSNAHDFPRNEYYLIYVEEDFKNFLDNSTPLEVAFKKVSRKLPGKITQAFNADQGFSYPIPLKKGAFKGFYEYCKVIVISKKEAGFLMFYCLYNDEGKKHLKQYQQDLTRLIGFTDQLYIRPPMPDSVVIQAGSLNQE